MCRYDKQIRLLQREQAELQEELQSCGSASTLDDRGYTCTNAKYISNPDDRKLAQKHYTKKQEPIRVCFLVPLQGCLMLWCTMLLYRVIHTCVPASGCIMHMGALSAVFM